LSAPALEANRGRYLKALGQARPEGPRDPAPWVSLTGMTGFINTPWAGVLPDRGIELGYVHVPKLWAYASRGEHVNETYYATLGALPRLEVSLRFTRIPGLQGFIDDPDNLITTDTDHMASMRLTLLTARPGR